MTLKLRQNIKMTRALVQKQIQKSFHRFIFGVTWHLIIPTFQLIIFFSLCGAINNDQNFQQINLRLLINL